MSVRVADSGRFEEAVEHYSWSGLHKKRGAQEDATAYRLAQDHAAQKLHRLPTCRVQVLVAGAADTAGESGGTVRASGNSHAKNR